jgi:hypothetical protein
MGIQGEKSIREKMTGIILTGLQFSWFEIIGVLWHAGKKIKQGFVANGLYEVSEYETTLELLDRKGKQAAVSKHQKVRYLQDHIIAYQDQAWGDGEILMNYQCSPGVPFDQYQYGHKSIILISLREKKIKAILMNSISNGE